MDRFVQHMAVVPQPKHKGELLVKVSARVEEVCQHEKISKDHVLIAFFIDLTAFGATTAPIRQDAENLSRVVCGAHGLAIILASDTPSNKGRPRPHQKE